MRRENKEVGIYGCVLGAKRTTCLSRIRVRDKEMAVLGHDGSKVATLLPERIRPAHLLSFGSQCRKDFPPV